MHRQIVINIISIALSVLTLSSCFVVPKEPEKIDFPEIRTGEVTYHVEEIRRQDLTNSITVYGVFQPELREGLYFKYAGGRLLEVYVEEEDEVKAGDILATLDVTGLESQVKLQRIALEKARIRLELLELSNANKYEYRLAELDAQAAEIRLADSLQRLSNNQIVAPFDGVITYVAADVGDYIEPFRSIISLENMDKMILECDPRNTQHLQEGMVVDVEFDRITYQGTVVRSYRDIISLGLEALDEERVQIDVPGIPEDIERSTSARVTVVIDESKDTIVISKSHVKYFGDRTFVYLLRNGVKVEQDVVLGIESRSKVEIVEGLTEGDQLIVK